MFLTKLEIMKRIFVGEEYLLEALQKDPEVKNRDVWKIIEQLEPKPFGIIKKINDLIDKLVQRMDQGDLEELDKSLEKYQSIIDLLEQDSVIIEKRRKAIMKFAEKAKSLRNERDEPILIDRFHVDCLRSIAYEMRLGEEVYVTTEELPTLFKRGGKDAIRIEPGEFAVLTTLEYLYIPTDIVAFISIRYGYKERGLVNVSGFHVDPGFYGKLFFTVYNAGPSDIVLKYKDRIFMIMFAKLGRRTEAYEGKHKGQIRLQPEVISALKGTSVSVRNLDERLKRLETIVYVLGAAILTAVITIILKVFLG